MIVVYDEKLERIIPDRKALEKRIAQAVDMVEYCRRKTVGDNIGYYQCQVDSILFEIVRLGAFRDEFDRLENMEGTSA